MTQYIENFPVYGTEDDWVLWFQRFADQHNELVSVGSAVSPDDLTVNPETGQVTTINGNTPLGYAYRYLHVRFASDADGSTQVTNLSTYTGSVLYVGFYNAVSQNTPPSDANFVYREFSWASGNHFSYTRIGGRDIRLDVSSAVPTGFNELTAAGIIDLEAAVTSGENGVDGYNSATLELFARSATSTAPADPTSTFTYTFSNGNLSPAPTTPWSTTAPDLTASFPYLFKITRSVQSRDATATISETDWSTAVIVGRYGEDGTDGSRGVGRWNIDVDAVNYASQTPDGDLPATANDAAEAWDEGVFTGTRPGNEIAGDQAWFFKGTQAAPTSQSVWIYSGTAWVEQDEVIDGNLLVTETVSLNKLEATASSGSRIVINGDGMAVYAGSESNPRIIVGNLEGTF